MPSDPNYFINSGFTLKFVRMISRLIPPGIGYRLAYLIADLMAGRKEWDFVKATRCNQWVVANKELTQVELDQAVRATFRNTAHSVYDLHHYVNDPKAINRLIEIKPIVQSIIDRSRTNECGQIVVSLHLGNFDLALQALTLKGLQGMVLSLPPTDSGYRVQYQIRRGVGVDVRPTDMKVLRQAVTWLRAGGTVIAAVDWPVPDSKYMPSFFGQPSVVAVHYIYLALKAKKPIIIAIMLREDDNRYRFAISEPIHMQTYPDRHMEIVRNAEAVLKVTEGFVRQAPHQWAMSRPIWPDLLDHVPI